uniref:F-box domain-containing protein n=1 Tax=Solanum tuberosum TaxID=4113 RepID=M1D3C7_SOLTU
MEPTIRKSKELLNSTWGTSFYSKYGFGYDNSDDSYKALSIDYCGNSYHDNVSNMKIVVNI